MENILSSEERYRRAYDLYLKRNNKQQSEVNIEVEPKIIRHKKNKLIFQITSSVLILSGIFLLKNINTSYAANALEKINGALEYNFDFNNMYNQTYEYIKDNVYSKFIFNETTEDDVAQIENIVIEESLQNEAIIENSIQETVVEETIENNIEEVTNSEAIDSKDSETENTAINVGGAQEDTSSYSQMELDAIDVKKRYTFIKPLEGTISSRYGIRNPTSSNVPKYHTGIDIAVVTGTEVKAAIGGTVDVVSTQGDYGYHIKILTDSDIITVYAHCSEFKVKEGDVVEQGQIIALSGNTGNTTGPHLHFEIRKDGRYVDPEYVLDF